MTTETPWRVNGPYHYDGDTHSSFNVYSPEGIVASFYAFDGDIAAAQFRAETYVGLSPANTRLATALRRIASLDAKNVSKYAQEIAREALGANT